MNKGAEIKAMDIFRKHKGPMRTTKAQEQGIHPRTIASLVKSKEITRLARGIYIASDIMIENQDLVITSLLVPKGVICLISALSFHNITTQIPHEIHVALPRPSKYPSVADAPPCRFYSFSGECYYQGIEEHIISGVKVRIYNPEKTVVDCFKFRNKIGLDVSIEALRYCIERKKSTPRQILRYAGICRVEKVIMPYLEACR